MTWDTKDFSHYLDAIPTHILEAGVGPISECRTRTYWGTQVRCTLFEPLPRFFVSLCQETCHHPNVRVYPIALWDHDERVTLYRFAQSTFVKGVQPRVARNPGRLRQAAIQVPSARISEFDTGDYDVALIDVEAAEWRVLKHLISRPKLLILELWKPKEPNYRHPDMQQIQEWLDRYGYVQVDRVGRDGVFRREA